MTWFTNGSMGAIGLYKIIQNGHCIPKYACNRLCSCFRWQPSD